MTPGRRAPCTCTAVAQPCEACLAWRAQQPGRGRPRGQQVAPPAELRLRGLTQHYEPGATTALLVPLAAWEVAWL